MRSRASRCVLLDGKPIEYVTQGDGVQYKLINAGISTSVASKLQAPTLYSRFWYERDQWTVAAKAFIDGSLLQCSREQRCLVSEWRYLDAWARSARTHGCLCELPL